MFPLFTSFLHLSFLLFFLSAVFPICTSFAECRGGITYDNNFVVLLFPFRVASGFLSLLSFFLCFLYTLVSSFEAQMKFFCLLSLLLWFLPLSGCCCFYPSLCFVSIHLFFLSPFTALYICLFPFIQR